MEAAEQAAASANQVSLFGDAAEENDGVVSMANVPEWNEREKLQNEKLALGYYFSGHPFNHFKHLVRGFAKTGIVCASYAQELASKHSLDTRAVMTSEMYRRVFPATTFAFNMAWIQVTEVI